MCYVVIIILNHYLMDNYVIFVFKVITPGTGKKEYPLKMDIQIKINDT